MIKLTYFLYSIPNFEIFSCSARLLLLLHVRLIKEDSSRTSVTYLSYNACFYSTLTKPDQLPKFCAGPLTSKKIHLDLLQQILCLDGERVMGMTTASQTPIKRSRTDNTGNGSGHHSHQAHYFRGNERRAMPYCEGKRPASCLFRVKRIK